MKRFALASLVALVAGCSAGSQKTAAVSPVGYVPPSPQRTGDAAAGYTALTNSDYIGCGIPWNIYQQFAAAVGAVGFGTGETLPGRTGLNATLPYFLTAFTGQTGTTLVTPNCLTCHASSFNGKLIIGLGNANGDYTTNLAPYAQALGGYATTLDERLEWQRWSEHISGIGPWMVTSTIGANPAETLSGAIFAHRDPKTLNWSHDPLMEMPPLNNPGLAVPAWWRVAKKNALYYDSSGRGDHAREMMTASSMCTDSMEKALAIDAFFPDVEAYIESIQPPVWPWAINQTLAAQGKTVFEATCSRCHGTYGQGGTYPNLVIDLPTLGTDPVLASAETSPDYARFENWVNASFYGALGGLAAAPGYIAPPLDGVWATAPYLHNWSVPSIQALLDSSIRPKYWTRTNPGDSTDYDQVNLGWNVTVLDHGKAGVADPATAAAIYDTTLPGYSNAGHTFGDSLSASDRAAVIEYLKTL